MTSFANMNHQDMLRVKLDVLQREHGDLDAAINALEAAPHFDHLALRRMKKQKLSLRDRIRAIEDELLPDIIA